MSGVNKAILLGHLGRDPEMRYMPDGTANATLNVATSETYKDRDGNKQERTEWHRAVFWGRTAEVAGEYLRKGSMVYIEGRLRTRKWTDKEGQDRYTTEIVGDRLQMVGSRVIKSRTGIVTPDKTVYSGLADGASTTGTQRLRSFMSRFGTWTFSAWVWIEEAETLRSRAKWLRKTSI